VAEHVLDAGAHLRAHRVRGLLPLRQRTIARCAADGCGSSAPWLQAWPRSRLKQTYYAWDWPANYDQDLRRIFSDDPKDADAPPATRFLRRVRPQLRARIAAGTGVHAYAVDQLLRQMIARAQKLGLRVIEPPSFTIEKLLVMLTMQTAGVVHTGYPKVAL
jgi:hypothetical protein